MGSDGERDYDALFEQYEAALRRISELSQNLEELGDELSNQSADPDVQIAEIRSQLMATAERLRRVSRRYTRRRVPSKWRFWRRRGRRY